MTVRVAGLNSLNPNSGTKKLDTDQIAEHYIEGGLIALEEFNDPVCTISGTSVTVSPSKYIVVCSRAGSKGNVASHSKFSVVFHVINSELISCPEDGFIVAKVNKAVVDSQNTSEAGMTEGSLLFVAGTDETDIDSAVPTDFYTIVAKVEGGEVFDGKLAPMNTLGADIKTSGGEVSTAGGSMDLGGGVINGMGNATTLDSAVPYGQMVQELNVFSKNPINESLCVYNPEYEVDNPIIPPTVVENISGDLEDGDWEFAYSYHSDTGETMISPSASVNIDLNHTVDLGFPSAISHNPNANGTYLYARRTGGDNEWRRYAELADNITAYGFDFAEDGWLPFYQEWHYDDLNTSISTTLEATESSIQGNYDHKFRNNEANDEPSWVQSSQISVLFEDEGGNWTARSDEEEYFSITGASGGASPVPRRSLYGVITNIPTTPPSDGNTYVKKIVVSKERWIWGASLVNQFSLNFYEVPMGDSTADIGKQGGATGDDSDNNSNPIGTGGLNSDVYTNTRRVIPYEPQTINTTFGVSTCIKTEVTTNIQLVVSESAIPGALATFNPGTGSGYYLNILEA